MTNAACSFLRAEKSFSAGLIILTPPSPAIRQLQHIPVNWKRVYCHRPTGIVGALAPATP
jgi:hypothetical protein